MTDISKVQDDEVGDGTTSVVVLACELLKVMAMWVVFFLNYTGRIKPPRACVHTDTITQANIHMHAHTYARACAHIHTHLFVHLPAIVSY